MDAIIINEWLVSECYNISFQRGVVEARNA
jgi:hypothetical protein